MSASLPYHKLLVIQQFAYSLLQTQTVAGFQVMSFLGNIDFCAIGNPHVCKLCHVIHRDVKY